MNNIKTISICTALAFSFFSIGLSGENLGLPLFFTMRDIALVLLMFSYFIVLLTEQTINFRSIKQINTSFILLSIIIIWILLSYLFSPYQDLVILEDIMAWAIIPICLILTYKISNYINKFYFVNVVCIILFITLFFVLVWIVVNVSDLMNFEEVRNFVDFNITIGLNRLLNGITFLNIISVGVALNILITNRFIYIISIVNVALSFLLSFITGSRQSLLTIIFTFIIMMIIKNFYKKTIKFNYKKIIFGALFVLFVFSLFQFEEFSIWIQERFVDKTTEQLTIGDKRTDIYLQALEDIKENPIFGTGPGTYHQISSLGMYTHNGYLSIMTNFGVIPFVLLITLFIYLIISSLKNRNFVQQHKIDIFIILFTTILVFIFVMNMFNDLFTRISFWMCIAILIDTYSKNYNYYKEQKTSKNF